MINNIIHECIMEFAAAWRPNPYLWLYEIDIQRELAHRITEKFPGIFRNIKARHHQDRTEERLFSRLTCEPYVKLDEKTRAFHPDIVIWGDKVDSCEFINDGCWPILWACEIKYVFEDKDFTKDYTKLAAILHRWPSATASQLIFVQDKRGPEHDVKETKEDGRLTVLRLKSSR